LLILGVETTGKAGSLALARARGETFEVLQLASLDSGAYSAQLVPMLAAMLARHGLRKNDIGGIAAASGPGSFTGLRVGLAAVKALAEVLRVPVAAVSLLEAIATAAPSGQPAGDVVIPLADAGRGEVFCGWYRMENGREQTGRELLLQRSELARMAHTGDLRGLLVTPDAALAEALRQEGLNIAGVPRPRADLIARLGAGKIAAGETVSPMDLDANYIRRSDAELFSAPGKAPAGGPQAK
jgi:tRNA threonylcarbamoyladenosine biosynthesis protein TsaB